MEVLNEETGELTEADEDAIAAQMTPDDDEGEPEPEEEQQPEERAPVGLSPEEREKRYKKLATSVGTYAARVGELLDFQLDELIACPCCGTVAHPGFVNKNDAGRVPDDVKAATMLFLGFPREQDYEPDPELRECSACKGRGEVMTGSKVPANLKRPCPNCKGYGYYPPLEDGAAPVAVLGTVHAPAGAAASPLAMPDPDPTGEPRILPDGRPNPNYGKWPQMKVPVEPYGVTAGLTAQDAPAPVA